MINTKAVVHIFVLLISVYTSTNAQQASVGLYLTAHDFKMGELSHSTKGSKLKLHEVIKKEIIEVKTYDSTYTYLKKEVYGYRDSDGNYYRLYNNKAYTILNSTEEILLYKITNGYPQKGQPQMFLYFFSKDAGSTICPLNMDTFYNAFNDNAQFQKIIEIHFSGLGNLLEYDIIHHKYKINRLLELSKTN